MDILNPFWELLWNFSIGDFPLGPFLLFLLPIVGVILLLVWLNLRWHRRAMLDWFDFAREQGLEYRPPKGSLQVYFELSDAELAQRHRPVPPLLALGKYLGSIQGKLSDTFTLELTVVNAGCIRNERPRQLALRHLSEAALEVLPEGLFYEPDPESRGSSAGDQRFTLLYLSVPELPAWLLRPQHLLHSLGAKTGFLQDIETGDSEFDRACLVQGDDPAEICAYLNEKRRFVLQETLRKVKTPGGILLLDANGIFYCRQGLLGRRRNLEAVFEPLLELAKTLYYLKV